MGLWVLALTMCFLRARAQYWRQSRCNACSPQSVLWVGGVLSFRSRIARLVRRLHACVYVAACHVRARAAAAPAGGHVTPPGFA